jgi:hypothetical protein
MHLGIRVVETESGEPAFTIADEEAVIRSLPECELSHAELPEATTVLLTCYPATMRLPRVDETTPIEVPEPKWQGWEWSRNEWILLHAEIGDGLPRLIGITIPDGSMCRLTIAGHPMRVRRFAPGDPGWTGAGYSVEVRGFLNDTTELWAQVLAPSAEACESLLVAVSTFSVIA